MTRPPSAAEGEPDTTLPLREDGKGEREAPPWRAATADQLLQRPIPRREWLVEGLIPSGTVTLLSGDGGSRKVDTCAQLAVAVATGSPWLGFTPKTGGAVYVSAEDDLGELARRIDGIATHYGITEGLRTLELLDITEEPETCLVTADRSGGLRPTDLMTLLDRKIAKAKPALLVLDAAADLFGANEIERTDVRQFIAMLRRLAQRHGPAVLLLAHPSRDGIHSGRGDSGSTAWANSVRSRLYLTADGPRRILKHMKANYASLSEDLGLRRAAGAFELEDHYETAMAAAVAEASVDALFLDLLRSYAASGRTVRPYRGRGYAPTEFADDPRARGVTRAGFEAAMKRLLAAEAIKVVESGPPSRRCYHLEIV